MSVRRDDKQNPLLRRDKWMEGNDEEAIERLCEASPQACDTYVASTLRRTVEDTPPFLSNDEEECGFPGCLTGPKWLQRLATRKTFLFVFCLSSVLQGMYYTYFVSVLTTIERLFQIKSQTAGVIMSATEVGQIVGGLLLSYYGGGGHRPRWIGSGMLLFGISASLSALPHFLFGDTLMKDFLFSALSPDNPLNTANICLNPEDLSVEMPSFGNTSVQNLHHWEEEMDSSDHSRHIAYSSKIVLGLFFVALLGVGLGQTAVYNLGIPYIDDNVASEESPTYFGTTMGVRIFGPTLGFVLGSLCTRLPVDPFSKSKFEPTDPRWIGAWWLGHLVISSSLIFTSFIMMMFPRRLRSAACRKTKLSTTRRVSLSSGSFRGSLTSLGCDIYPFTKDSLSLESSSFLKTNGTKPLSSSRPCAIEILFDHPDINNSLKKLESPVLDQQSERAVSAHCINSKNANPEQAGAPSSTEERSIKDFLSVVYRLLTNQILVLRTVSSVLHLLPIAGLYTFLPKYIETQFRLPVHSAAMISGVGGILVMGFGIFVSGFVIRRSNPSPRTIAGWIGITALLYSIAMVILMFLGCSHHDVHGRIDIEGNYLFRPLCERSCSACNEKIFAPICTTEGKTYFSACHAGCSTVTLTNITGGMEYGTCECLEPGVKAQLRLCEAVCPNLLWYIAVFCFFVIIHSTSEVGGMMLTLRCVSPGDKAMALGLISVAIGLFGNVPCPILYGAVIDYSCIHWRESGDGEGACQIYDTDIFRMFFHGTTAFVMFMAFCVDVCVWRCYKNSSFSTNGNAEATEHHALSSLQTSVPSTTVTFEQGMLSTSSSLSSADGDTRREEQLQGSLGNNIYKERDT